MDKVIDFSKKKKELQHRQKMRVILRDIVEKLDRFRYPAKKLEKHYYNYPPHRLVKCLVAEKQKNKFNKEFLTLLTFFMKEECPDLGLRFDNFLDKIRKTK